jgi:hypothetical protein
MEIKENISSNYQKKKKIIRSVDEEQKSIRISLFDSEWHLVHLGWELLAGEGLL